MKSSFALIISVVSLLISIVLVIVALPSSGRPDFDYLGLLVGILSFLVTLLLGWQIYNSLTIHSQIDSLKKLYAGISDKNKDLEERLKTDKFLLQGMVEVTENTVYFSLASKEPKGNMVEMANTYIRYIECMSLFLQARDPRYTQFCMLNADKALDVIADGIEHGVALPSEFHVMCDRLFRDSIHPHMGFLSADDTTLFFQIQDRRKSLGTDHPLPSPVNPYGVQLKEMRVGNPPASMS